MKKLVFLVIALLAIVSLAGCGGGNNGGTDNNSNGNGNGDGNGTDTAQWLAYSFGDTVKPSSGGSGKVKTFTINSVYSDEGKVREFNLAGTYLGTEMTQIVTQKMVTSTTPPYMSTTNVTTSLECYKVIHRVTVVKDETGGSHPAWADITVWIPTGRFQTTNQYFWIYPKAIYADSDGHTGASSCYITDAMLSEMNNPPAGTSVIYSPVVEGEFYGYDLYAFQGLYGWGWFWFKEFAEGGQQHLKVGSSVMGGYTYTCSKGTKTIGGYTFSTWSVNFSAASGGSAAGYEGVFSPDLPLPIHWKYGWTGGGTGSYFENTLTALQLQ